MLQQVLVILIVIAAALSAAWRLSSVPARLRLLEALLRRMDAEGIVASALQRVAQKQRAALLEGGCAACSANAGARKTAGQPRG